LDFFAWGPAQRTCLTRAALRTVGLAADIISGAGTGTYEHKATSEVANALQTGSDVFMDADSARIKRADSGAFTDFEPALFITPASSSARPSTSAACAIPASRR
jgi:3-hydroxy-D-aspartate aldolase